MAWCSEELETREDALERCQEILVEDARWRDEHLADWEAGAAAPEPTYADLFDAFARPAA